jgi:hypothetical protein
LLSIATSSESPPTKNRLRRDEGNNSKTLGSFGCGWADRKG